jgi:hypothetical protein
MRGDRDKNRRNTVEIVETVASTPVTQHPLATLNPPNPAFAAAYRGGPVSERHSTRKHQRRLVSQNGETTGSRGAQEPVRRAVENGGNLPACSS